MIRNILLIHRDINRGKSIVNIVSGSNLKVSVISNLNEAIKKVMQEELDLIMIDALYDNPLPTDLLFKIREKRPEILRSIIIDGEDPGFAFDDLVNKAGVCAVFKNPLDRNVINKIIDEYKSPSGGGGEDTAALTAKIAELEKKLKKTERDLQIARKADNILKDEEMNVAELKSKQASSKLGVEIKIDYRADDLESEVIKALIAMIDSPSVILPVPPKVAQEVQKLLKQTNIEFSKISEVISCDPVISSKVLKICNSPMYAGVEKITNVDQAVSRLGIKQLRDIVQTAATESLFKTEIKGMETLMNKLWMHSLVVAHANMSVVDNLGIDDKKDFFVMGLLHDIGKLLIANLVQQGFENGLWNTNMVTPTMVLSIFQKCHNDFGVRILQKWEYPETVIDVVKLHNDEENIHKHPEGVVVTFYSNVLSRKLGYSFKKYDEDILNGHDLAQALNLTDDTRTKIEKTSVELINRIKESYF